MGKSSYLGFAALALLVVPTMAEAKWKGDSNGKTYKKLGDCFAENTYCSVARLVRVADIKTFQAASPTAARSRSGRTEDVVHYVVAKPGTRHPVPAEGQVNACLTKGGSVHANPPSCAAHEQPIVVYE